MPVKVKSDSPNEWAIIAIVVIVILVILFCFLGKRWYDNIPRYKPVAEADPYSMEQYGQYGQYPGAWDPAQAPVPDHQYRMLYVST